MEKVAVSCRAVSWTDKQTGAVREFYEVFIIDDFGSVGKLFANKMYKPGEKVPLQTTCSREGRLVLRVVE